MSVPWSERFRHDWRFGQCWSVLTGLIIGLMTTGCTSTGSGWAWKNPFPTGSTAVTSTNTLTARIREAQVAADEAADLSGAEKSQVSGRLVQAYREESHPAARKAIVEALGSYRTPTAMEGLRAALQDADRDVRIAACESLARWAAPESYQLLAQTARSETDVDVRLAATRLLGGIEDPTAVGALRSALEDSDPAVQYVAMQALKQTTGQDLGNDLGEWKRIAREFAPSDGPNGGSPADRALWR